MCGMASMGSAQQCPFVSRCVSVWRIVCEALRPGVCVSVFVASTMDGRVETMHASPAGGVQ